MIKYSKILVYQAFNLLTYGVFYESSAAYLGQDSFYFLVE